MRLMTHDNADVNYLAQVVDVKEFRKHPNPNVERLKCCSVKGFNIIVGIDSQPGPYVFFTAMTEISPRLLRYANLYQKPTLNANNERSGMFGNNGRVKAVRLKGETSDGFLLPMCVLRGFCMEAFGEDITNISDGMEFDGIEDDDGSGDRTEWICRKFIPKAYRAEYVNGRKPGPNDFDRMVDGQFRFHYETTLLRKCPEVLTPDTMIHISKKYHGTSGVSANVLCRNKDGSIDYGRMHSSRRTFKDRWLFVEPSPTDVKDIWDLADDIVGPCLEKGMTAYYEIVGYMPSGRFIQRQYDYGCVQPAPGDTDHVCGRHYRVLVYRLVHTGTNGLTYEYNPLQVAEWCRVHGLEHVGTLFHGVCRKLYPDIPRDGMWARAFIDRLATEREFFMERMSPDCANKVPHEGIVIRTVDNMPMAYKLKCFRFLDREQDDLDSGIADMDTIS